MFVQEIKFLTKKLNFWWPFKGCVAVLVTLNFCKTAILKILTKKKSENFEKTLT